MIAALRLAQAIAEHRRLLFATTRVEFQRRYAGSALGMLWVALNPLLFLCVYMFLFLVVFKMRLPGLSNLGYVTMVFSGLVPFLASMEVASVSAASLKQNMHLIKNVIMPIDLIPVRVVLMAMATQGVGLILLIGLAGIDGALGAKVLWMLPLALLIQFFFLLGFALIFAPLGVLAPDINHAIGTLMLFLMFLSPIAFDQSMVPEPLRFITILNPANYLIESFRMAVLNHRVIDWNVYAIFAALAMVVLVIGATLTRRFKSVVVDYE
ncbi:ABC transporter permease [Vitreimonas sp.]|uniref:ABC transporter permease n=1 Tax=Vitreimonas sp. TaxID=3069702 RepID=UPI002EDA56F4